MPPQTKEMLLTVELVVELRKDGDWIIVHSPALGIASQGKTNDEAKHNFEEAVSLYFDSCFERNVLDEALKECGFTNVGLPTDRGKLHYETISVPLNLVSTSSRENRSQCPA